MDTIFIREFRVDAWVGIYEWEKQRAQTLEMEIEIGIPGNEVGRTDNIHDTVHYGEVVERIVAEHPAARVVMVSSVGYQDNILAALQKGARHFVQKPVKPDALYEIIRYVLNDDGVTTPVGAEGENSR